MNSKTEKTPEEQKKLPNLSPAEQADLLETSQQVEMVARHQTAKCAQLERVVWLLVRKAGGAVTINESTVDPLWKLTKSREQNGEITLVAEAMEGPSEDKLSALTKALLGTSRPLFEVAREVGLEAFPPAFLAFRISDRVIFLSGTWTDAALAKEQMSQRPAQN